MKNETFSFSSVSLQKGRKSSLVIKSTSTKSRKNRFFSLGSVFFIKIRKFHNQLQKHE